LGISEKVLILLFCLVSDARDFVGRGDEKDDPLILSLTAFLVSVRADGV
jgi:hypothetical protein